MIYIYIFEIYEIYETKHVLINWNASNVEMITFRKTCL